MPVFRVGFTLENQELRSGRRATLREGVLGVQEADLETQTSDRSRKADDETLSLDMDFPESREKVTGPVEKLYEEPVDRLAPGPSPQGPGALGRR